MTSRFLETTSVRSSIRYLRQQVILTLYSGKFRHLRWQSSSPLSVVSEYDSHFSADNYKNGQLSVNPRQTILFSAFLWLLQTEEIEIFVPGVPSTDLPNSFLRMLSRLGAVSFYKSAISFSFSLLSFLQRNGKVFDCVSLDLFLIIGQNFYLSKVLNVELVVKVYVIDFFYLLHQMLILSS